ncbi:MAG: AAA family ATPase, partial [Candidatus Freyarchaeota archaeon]
MKIRAIRLENIRSHVKTSVTFADGFNCLVGGLGCGKSSILYAIDFALIGEPLRRGYAYLLREGEDIGKISIEFVHGGKTYTIFRALRRRGKDIGQDMEQLKLYENGTLIASAKSEAVAE